MATVAMRVIVAATSHQLAVLLRFRAPLLWAIGVFPEDAIRRRPPQ